MHVAKDLGPSMSHFTSDVDAIVIGSYQDQYGGGNTRDYTVHLKGHGECSWYHESQLEMIESGRSDLLKTWQADRDAEAKQKADLDWIFANGPDVLESAHGASIATLAKEVGITDLWGSHGEGLSYYENAMRVLSIAAPFLEKKDKHGWLAFCQTRPKLSAVDYRIR